MPSASVVTEMPRASTRALRTGALKLPVDDS